VPFLDFSRLQNALAGLEKAADEYSQLSSATPKAGANLANLNKLLYQAEQKLLLADGLPNRSWFKHSIYAPGFYTGYGVKTLPGIREAIEQRDWKTAQVQIENAAKAITAYTEQVNAASKLLK
jgi:N-acetylated-alpha-linked acidic dipeptidase